MTIRGALVKKTISSNKKSRMKERKETASDTHATSGYLCDYEGESKFAHVILPVYVRVYVCVSGFAYLAHYPF